MGAALDQAQLVHPKEPLYFGIAVAFSAMVYLVLVLSLVGLIYLVLGALIGLVSHGLFVGHIRGNGVRVSERQFPEVYRLTQELARQMGLERVPAVYVVEAGGFLNAFATRFLRRDFVVVFSDVLALAYERGEAELAFVIAHELAHIHRGHLAWRWFLYPALLVPFLSQAYSRACEYTCDRIAAWCRPDGAAGGLLALAAGKHLYRRVDREVFAEQARTERGFWIWLAEVLSSHPHLPRRLAALSQVLPAPAGSGPDRPAAAPGV